MLSRQVIRDGSTVFGVIVKGYREQRLFISLLIVLLLGCNAAPVGAVDFSPLPKAEVEDTHKMDSSAHSSHVSSASEHQHAYHHDEDHEEGHEHMSRPGFVYVCPMHPEIVQDGYGHCPICGMDLVAKAAMTATDDAHPVVILSATVIQNMNVRIAPVERGTLHKKIRTQGTVAYDEERILQVHSRTSGWIENLYVRKEGERVKRGDDLADYFSPYILKAEAEFIELLDQQDFASLSGGGSGQAELRAARETLRYLWVPEMLIQGMEDTRSPRELQPIKAPQGGIITMHGVSEGQYVDPFNIMFTIVDLSQVWVIADIYEHQIARLKPGLSAEVTSAAYPGQRWKGVVDFIYPEVNPQTRTVRVRLIVKNPAEMLLPNMFTEVVIQSDVRRDALHIAREAVIVTGEREMVVKALGNGRFQSVDVKTGMSQGRRVEILSGLDEGDNVVLSGQFLIDSESTLQANFKRMDQ